MKINKDQAVELVMRTIKMGQCSYLEIAKKRFPDTWESVHRLYVLDRIEETLDTWRFYLEYDSFDGRTTDPSFTVISIDKNTGNIFVG